LPVFCDEMYLVSVCRAKLMPDEDIESFSLDYQLFKVVILINDEKTQHVGKKYHPFWVINFDLLVKIYIIWQGDSW
jgi:hypothetical protein